VSGSSSAPVFNFPDADLLCYGGVNEGSSCGSNQVMFEVAMLNGAGAFIDEGFSFVVLGDQ